MTNPNYVANWRRHGCSESAPETPVLDVTTATPVSAVRTLQEQVATLLATVERHESRLRALEAA